jgi:hypothetical protein
MPRTVRNGSVDNPPRGAVIVGAPPRGDVIVGAPPRGAVIVGAVVGSERGDQAHGGVDYHCKKK